MHVKPLVCFSVGRLVRFSPCMRDGSYVRPKKLMVENIPNCWLSEELITAFWCRGDLVLAWDTGRDNEWISEPFVCVQGTGCPPNYHAQYEMPLKKTLRPAIRPASLPKPIFVLHCLSAEGEFTSCGGVVGSLALSRFVFLLKGRADQYMRSWVQMAWQ